MLEMSRRLAVTHEHVDGPVRKLFGQSPQQQSADQPGSACKKNGAAAGRTMRAAEPHSSAPPQLEPAPAVQPKQCMPVEIRCPAS